MTVQIANGVVENAISRRALGACVASAYDSEQLVVTNAAHQIFSDATSANSHRE